MTNTPHSCTHVFRPGIMDGHHLDPIDVEHPCVCPLGADHHYGDTPEGWR